MLFSTPVNPFGTLGTTQILDMTHHLKNEEKLLIKEFRAISKQLLSFMSKIAKWGFSLKICFSLVLAFPALEYTKHIKKE